MSDALPDRGEAPDKAFGPGSPRPAGALTKSQLEDLLDWLETHGVAPGLLELGEDGRFVVRGDPPDPLTP